MSQVITCNALLPYSSAPPVPPSVPLGLLAKLWAWYDFDNNGNDSWGCFPLANSNLGAGTYEAASLHGGGIAGLCLRGSLLRSYPILPNWGTTPTDFFLGGAVSTPGFVSLDQTAFLIRNGFNEAINLADNTAADGFSVRTVNGAVPYMLESVDAVNTWAQIVSEHNADGTVRYHRNSTLNYAITAGAPSLNPFDTAGLGASNGTRPQAAITAYLFFGKGTLTAQEVAYLWNYGAGRTLPGIVADAGGITPVIHWTAIGAFTSFAQSYDGKRVAADNTAGNQCIGDVGHNSGKWWGVAKKFQHSGGSAAIIGFTDSVGSIAGYLVTDGGASGHVAASIGFTLVNDPFFSTFNENDNIMWAHNADTKKFWFGVNGVWAGNPALGTGEALTYTSSAIIYPFLYTQDPITSFELALITADMPYANPSGFTPWAD